jgi:hemolysin activation/secretion protein
LGLRIAIILATAAALLSGAEPPQSRESAVFHVRSIRVQGAQAAGIDADRIGRQSVEVREVDGVLTAAEPGQGRSMTLAEFDGSRARRVDASVLRAIATAVLRAFTESNIAAVRVAIPQAPLRNVTAEDGDGVLEIAAQVGQAAAVRTLRRTDSGAEPATGEWYERLAGDSPVQSDQLIRLDEINRYVAWLNRRPGRRVDASLSSLEDGRLALDYLVTEDKPWSVLYEASNTGTAQTSRWRQRFGFLHTNLTRRDDILTLDYVTSDFDSVHAFSGSYETPVPGLQRLRVKALGSWSTYVASDVGLAGLQLEGESVSVGGEAAWNFFQLDTFFLDLVAGAHFDYQHVENQAAGTNGRTDFLIPYLGLRGDHRGQTSATFFSLMLQTNFPSLADTDADQLALLGRSETGRDWRMIQFSAGHDGFLDPLLRENWGKPDGDTTLAHELFTSLRGQVVLGDDRVAPSYTQTLGGFHTVRGYPESFVAADNALIATAEYRLHIPRLFSAVEPGEAFGRPFRFQPEPRTGRVDWDLIFRAFLDAGYVWHNDRQTAFEDNVGMVGAGVGAELQVLRNFTARIDWGVALHTADSGGDEIDAGSQRVHVSFTVSY